jgi:spore germination protein GerM
MEEASLIGEDEDEVVLYFADTEGRLAPENRILQRQTRPADQARAIVQALLDGPVGPGPTGALSPVLPPETSIRAVHLGPEGTAYVDLDAAFARGLSYGSEDALIAVRALTETLAANLPEVSMVKILVEGEEVRDLGGHLDLSRPLIPTASILNS